MIPGQKELNVTYDTMAVDFDAPDKQIIGETCMDIRMAEDYADALLSDEDSITRKEALEFAEIILRANEHLKHREYCFDSIKCFRECSEERLDAAQIAHETRKQTEALIKYIKEDSTMEEKMLEFITRPQEILRFRLDTGEECEAMPVRAEEDGTVYVFVDCLKEEMHMNPTDTMEGGYEASFMRGYLNNEVLSHFPEELEDLLIPVNSLGDLLTLPSKEEIFGEPEDPEKQWPAMKLRRNRIAFQGLNGDPEWYWLRSVYSATWAAFVVGNGFAYGGNASYVYGVRPAFKIANR